MDSAVIAQLLIADLPWPGPDDLGCPACGVKKSLGVSLPTQ